MILLRTHDNAKVELPDDLANDWIRFARTKRSIAELADWTELKAAEYGWDFFDLSAVLVHVVHRPELPALDDERTEARP